MCNSYPGCSRLIIGRELTVRTKPFLAKHDMIFITAGELDYHMIQSIHNRNSYHFCNDHL